jgi:hypothetical protein
MNEYNAGILRGLLEFPTALTFSNGLLPCPLGSIAKVSAKSLGLVLGDTTGRDWLITLMFVRFKATVASAGRVCHFTSDSTYGYHCVTSTWDSTLTYNNAGISCHAVAAAGDYGVIQVGGLNGWAMTAAAAAIAIGDIVYPTATNEISVADTDAKRVQKVGVAEVVDANGGATTVGMIRLTPNGVAL